MMKNFAKLFVAAMLAGSFGLAGAAMDEEKVVYHINDSTVAKAAMGNVKNHLNAVDGKAKIVIVTHGKGIDFLFEGAADKDGNPYNINVEELIAKGVEFKVCNNTIVNRKLDPTKLLPGSTIVPSGVAEVARLQSKEGYVYLKP